MLKLISVILLTSLLTMSCTGQSEEQRQDAVDTIPTLVYRVQQCSRLYTTEYHIHKIITHEDILRLKGNVMGRDINVALPLGERKVAIPMDATLKAWIDLSDFSEKNITREGNHLSILLPDPQITLTSSKIRQNDIHEYVGMMRSHFTDKEMTAYQQQGRKAILESIDQQGFIKEAQANAARVLVPLIVQLGFQEQDISIIFRKDMNVTTLVNQDVEKP